MAGTHRKKIGGLIEMGVDPCMVTMETFDLGVSICGNELGTPS